MSDEPAKIILADTAIAAAEITPTRRWFGRPKDRQIPPFSHCENCGAELLGHWCSQCGQPAVDYRRSFRHVITDVLDSFLNWDSKFFATIGLLVVKPWRLTNDFVSGKRIRYVNPLRLYLLASVLFFFAMNHWARSIRQPTIVSSRDRAELEAVLKNEDLPPVARAKIEEALKFENAIPRPTTGPNENASPGPTTAPQVDVPPLRQIPLENRSSPSEDWIEKRVKEKVGEHGTHAQLFMTTLFNNLPYMMLACIPLFALVLKLLYLRRRILYLDHLTYALHIHTFAYVGVTLLVFATSGLNRIASGPLAGSVVALLWILFSLQILLSIRNVYRQSWVLSLCKFLLGGFIYLMVVSAALAATFLVTLAS
jgi:hypothetical protein